MTDPDNDIALVVAFTQTGPPAEELAYSVELWDLPRLAIERILARAATVGLARAIFTNASAAYPGRHLTLKHGERVIVATD